MPLILLFNYFRILFAIKFAIKAVSNIVDQYLQKNKNSPHRPDFGEARPDLGYHKTVRLANCNKGSLNP